MDVLNTMQLVEATIASIQEKRDNSDRSFKALYEKSTKLAGEMGTEIQKHRITKLQKNRSNIQIESVEDYYRTSVFIPFLDFILNELTTRFPKHEMKCVGKLQMPLSSNFEKGYHNEILEGAYLYKDDLPCFSALEGELQIWKYIWKSLPEKKRPKHPAQAYRLADAPPNVRMLLQLLCTLPVTTSTAERSFSALRRLKT
ncbi:hypothetical protein QE152_g29234 [Popillia japonica]|uniref:HAT C-terminal dimerisation domain-containing protein n=1 Tax=Popillia japonica TaxID=7064 RepID=A0AAW1JHN0_POPJA